MSSFHRMAGRAYDLWDVPLSKKDMGDDESLKRLGLRIARLRGRISHTGERQGRLVGLTWHCLQSRRLSRLAPQVAGGHWTHAHAVRKEASCCLSAFWRKVLAMPAGRPSYVCREVKEELWACLALLAGHWPTQLRAAP